MKVLILVCFVLCGTAFGQVPSNSGVDKICFEPPPTDVDPLTCCKIPEMLDPTHIDDCAKKVFKGGPIPETPVSPDAIFSPQIRCISECIFNATGIFKERSFQPNIALDLARKALAAQPEWIPVVEDSIKTCNDHVIKNKLNEKKACGHQAAFLVACLNTQLFKNCPAKAWTEAKGCGHLKDLTTKCPIIAPIPAQDRK